MNKTQYNVDWPDIDTNLFNRSAKLFNAVKNMLSVKLELHADNQALQGDIFLFNHFSRFETFIPQFLIFENTGLFSCAIASGEFFEEDNTLSQYLKNVGVFPHDHPNLFPLLAKQILRGRKVIIFPEGAMIKDRQVIDKRGEYNIHSRSTGKRRKMHTGPAVLGQGVEVIKAAIRHAFSEKNMSRLQQWKADLEFDTLDQLMAVALKPTTIVPANITFYPIRTSENLLFKSVELFADDLSLRQSEELLIEGNIVLKNTDMDVRMGTPVDPCCAWDWKIRYLVDRVAPGIHQLDDVYRLKDLPKSWKERLLGYLFVTNVQESRNQYMKRIYTNITINLSHLASTLIMFNIGMKQLTVSQNRFYTILYIAIKQLQNNTEIYLHRSLLNPNEYSDFTNKRFEQFICLAKEADLIAEENNNLLFLPKLCEEYDFDSIRLENPIAVYCNEAAPIKVIRETLEKASNEFDNIDTDQYASWHFEDECRALAWEQQTYSNGQFNGINCQEIIVADPSPFLIQPDNSNGFGVLLVHGLLASPAELRAFGDHLASLGFTALGIRLRGHGTSPYALRESSWEDWYACLQRGTDILKFHCEKLFIVGFSTGGALGLKLASEQIPEIVGIIAVSVPLKFVNPAFMLVPLLYGTNKLVDWVSSYEGVKPFVENTPEHPDINYRNIPVRSLYELRKLIQHIDDLLPEISIPSLIVYADHDPIVSPSSAPDIFKKLGSENKRLHTVESDRHGILMENIDGIWKVIDEFMDELLDQHKLHAPTSFLLDRDN